MARAESSSGTRHDGETVRRSSLASTRGKPGPPMDQGPETTKRYARVGRSVPKAEPRGFDQDDGGPELEMSGEPCQRLVEGIATHEGCPLGGIHRPEVPGTGEVVLSG